MDLQALCPIKSFCVSRIIDEKGLALLSDAGLLRDHLVGVPNLSMTFVAPGGPIFSDIDIYKSDRSSRVECWSGPILFYEMGFDRCLFLLSRSFDSPRLYVLS